MIASAPEVWWIEQATSGRSGRQVAGRDGRQVGGHSLSKIVGVSCTVGWMSRVRAIDGAAAVSPRASRTWPAIRVCAAVGYLVGFSAQCLWWGWPTDTLLIFGWLCAGVVCWNAGQPWCESLRWGRDWGPVLVCWWAMTTAGGSPRTGWRRTSQR